MQGCISIDEKLKKEKDKLNKLVVALGCLHEKTIKQSQLVDRLIVMKIRKDLQKVAV
jgi:hypothetical protein